MTTQHTKSDESRAHSELGDETFMSAADLRKYMTEMQMANASKEISAMDRAGNARKDLIKTLAEPLDLSPERLQAITQSVLQKLRIAAQRGQTELMVMRFPVEICADHGRAINNSEPDWPESLTGRPRQAYELWRDRLKPAGYKLKAMIVEWPGGLPGDVGLFLNWGETKH